MKTEYQAYERTDPGGRWGRTEFMSLGVEVMFFTHF